MTSLTKEEIEEEIINNDLINSGGIEDEESLQSMNLEEKKNLLHGLKKSMEGSQNESPGSARTLDISNFPSLSTPGRSGTTPRSQKPGLKLPRRLSSGVAAVSSGEVISLIDDNDDVEPRGTRFFLPGCQGDNAAPLKMPDRPILKVDSPMYRMEGESPSACLRRMLQTHDLWKRAYDAEMHKIETCNLTEDLEEEEESRAEAPSDVFAFKSDSPLQVSKTYSLSKSKSNTASPSNSASGSRQRRTSRDSDQENEVILKPADSKMGEWIMAGTRQKNKRNKKTTTGVRDQTTERDKGKETSPDVEFKFEEKWDPQTNQWPKPGNQSSPSVISRRNLGRSPIVEEDVQCPICLKAFPRSEVENHAANCEGYSGDPMDVEEGN